LILQIFRKLVLRGTQACFSRITLACKAPVK
jgi:hypothetical protein